MFWRQQVICLRACYGNSKTGAMSCYKELLMMIHLAPAKCMMLLKMDSNYSIYHFFTLNKFSLMGCPLIMKDTMLLGLYYFRASLFYLISPWPNPSLWYQFYYMYYIFQVEIAELSKPFISVLQHKTHITSLLWNITHYGCNFISRKKLSAKEGKIDFMCMI